MGNKEVPRKNRSEKDPDCKGTKAVVGAATSYHGLIPRKRPVHRHRRSYNGWSDHNTNW